MRPLYENARLALTWLECKIYLTTLGAVKLYNKNDFPYLKAGIP